MADDLMKHSMLMRQFVEVTPHKVGHRVKISPSNKYAADWPGEYVITGMCWEYLQGSLINFEIASDDDIINRHGPTDGWKSDDLVPIPRR